MAGLGVGTPPKLPVFPREELDFDGGRAEDYLGNGQVAWEPPRLRSVGRSQRLVVMGAGIEVPLFTHRALPQGGWVRDQQGWAGGPPSDTLVFLGD